MNCWICGSQANSREHMTKASDLRALYGSVNNQSPLYLHSGANLNRKVQGIASRHLTFSAPICGDCNNRRTQPHDLAWQSLSTYMRGRGTSLRPGMLLNLSDVFPGKVKTSMHRVHFYFVKLFGCRIAQDRIPIDLGPFRAALLNEQPHPMIHLTLCVVTHDVMRKSAGLSEVRGRPVHGPIEHAAWSYNVGSIAVNVLYATADSRLRGLAHSWHPTSVSKRVRVIEF